MTFRPGWTIRVDRPLVVYIPDTRETDARAEVAAWMRGERDPGHDWQITEDAPTIVGVRVSIDPNGSTP